MNGRTEKPHIVLIEDSDDDVFLVKYTLGKRAISCDLTRFEDGRTAFEAIASAHASRQPDLILLDLNLPLCNGRELLKALRANPSLERVPIAVITSSVAPRDQQDAISLGADRYVQKPSDLREFVEKVGDAVIDLLRVDIPEYKR